MSITNPMLKLACDNFEAELTAATKVASAKIAGDEGGSKMVDLGLDDPPAAPVPPAPKIPNAGAVPINQKGVAPPAVGKQDPNAGRNADGSIKPVTPPAAR